MHNEQWTMHLRSHLGPPSPVLEMRNANFTTRAVQRDVVESDVVQNDVVQSDNSVSPNCKP